MAYFRHAVQGGEYVLRGDRFWQLTFNGVQIGGLYRAPDEALTAIDKRRSGVLAGADLTGIPDPPADLRSWAGD